MNEDNWSKLIQAGAPMKGLAPEYPLSKMVSNVSYKKGNSAKLTVLTKDTQLEIWEELLGFKPNEYDAPIICISAPGHDRFPIRQAVELMSHFIDNGMRVRWHTLGSGYRTKQDLIFNTDVLFISNVVASSTPHRLELLRDVVCLNHKSLRVIVTAGWDAMELSKHTSIPLNGLVHLGRMKR